MARHAGKTTVAARVNVPFCVALVLLCLTLVSLHLTSGLFARYTASAEFEDSARVAKFSVTSSSSTLSDQLIVEMTPYSGQPIGPERILQISNDSEVAVDCTVTVQNVTKNIPLTFSLDGAQYVSEEQSATFHMEPGQRILDCSIFVWWSAQDALRYMGMVDLVEITISVEQVD